MIVGQLMKRNVCTCRPGDSLERAADSITFQKLLEESSEKEKMYYI